MYFILYTIYHILYIPRCDLVLYHTSPGEDHDDSTTTTTNNDSNIVHKIITTSPGEDSHPPEPSRIIPIYQNDVRFIPHTLFAYSL